MRFEKGKPKTGGRKAGTPNKVTVLLRDRLEAIVETLDPEGLAEEIVASKDVALRWDLLKWHLEKLYGKPKQPIENESPLVASPEWVSLKKKLVDALSAHPAAAAAVHAVLTEAADFELAPPIIVSLDFNRATGASED